MFASAMSHRDMDSSRRTNSNSSNSSRPTSALSQSNRNPSSRPTSSTSTRAAALTSSLSSSSSSSGPPIPPETLAEWQDIFSLFDFSQTGFISTSDLGTVIRGLGHNVSEEQVNSYLNQFDHDGSGQLDFQTFVLMMRKGLPEMKECRSARELVEDFRVFDMYREGKVSVAEMVDLLRNRGEPLTNDDVEHLLRETAIDGDNKIDIQEFITHMFRTSAPA